MYLEPKEKKTVSITLDNRAFSFYNTAACDWCVENGEYEILVGSSSMNLPLTVKIKASDFDNSVMPDYSQVSSYFTDKLSDITNEEFEKLYGSPLPMTIRRDKSDLNTTLFDKSDKGIAKVVCKAVDKITENSKDVNAGMIANAIVQTPIRNFITMSNGLFSEDMADGLIDILDGEEKLKGAGKIAKGVPNALLNLKKLLKSI